MPSYTLNNADFKPIVDFRNLSIYPFTKFLKVELSTKCTNEDETLLMLAYTMSSRYDDIMFLKDSFTLDINEGDTIINIVPSSSTPLVVYSGIYDIVLKDCENVREVSLVFTTNNKRLEVPISFTKENKKEIRIPLTVPHEPTHYFHRVDESLKANVSYIPTACFKHTNTTLSIKLNAGAYAKASISTIYLPRQELTRLVNSTTLFYVDGTRILTRDGIVFEYSDKLYNSSIFANLFHRRI